VGLAAGFVVTVPWAVLQSLQRPHVPSAATVLMLGTALTGWLTTTTVLADRLAPLRVRAFTWGLAGLVAGAALSLEVPPDWGMATQAAIWALPAMALGLMVQQQERPLWQAPLVALVATAAGVGGAHAVSWSVRAVTGLALPAPSLGGLPQSIAFYASFVGAAACAVSWCLHLERRRLEREGA